MEKGLFPNFPPPFARVLKRPSFSHSKVQSSCLYEKIIMAAKRADSVLSSHNYSFLLKGILDPWTSPFSLNVPLPPCDNKPVCPRVRPVFVHFFPLAKAEFLSLTFSLGIMTITK
jgi:hypothetical protein